mmetsp:Transcript_6297/g.10529  ORF Transcript_6297/g.10529 Transcript_6297/m.10529 type:complete len:321 (+) Transcript_6297:1746-2708(+)
MRVLFCKSYLPISQKCPKSFTRVSDALSAGPLRQLSTISTPSPSVPAKTISTKVRSRLLPICASSKPNHFFMCARLCAEHVVNTSMPRRCAKWMAAWPTPPAPPCTSMLWPASRRAFSNIAYRAVRYTTGTVAASARVISGGTVHVMSAIVRVAMQCVRPIPITDRLSAVRPATSRPKLGFSKRNLPNAYMTSLKFKPANSTSTHVAVGMSDWRDIGHQVSVAKSPGRWIDSARAEGSPPLVADGTCAVAFTAAVDAKEVGGYTVVTQAPNCPSCTAMCRRNGFAATSAMDCASAVSTVAVCSVQWEYSRTRVRNRAIAP